MNLPTGVRSGVISIYDARGVVVRSYEVTDQFADVLVQRESLTAGLYTYRLVAESRVLSTGKLMIQ